MHSAPAEILIESFYTMSLNAQTIPYTAGRFLTIHLLFNVDKHNKEKKENALNL